ncbi:hypothetical protein [Vitreimonas flagellata]|uniref:hypothetical protein n=1 Tax=Vitreimonas flagellata TaxID=2560861 RepID=UPI00142FCA8A|nr:hypothetical protein [Vitreimonas flagellata]
MAETKFKRRAPVGLILLALVLTGITGALIYVGVQGFVLSNWLVPYWNNLSDAQATILAQFIFLLGAAWATVLLPLLFAGRLRSLEDAAASAQEAYDGIKAQLVDSAEESKRQLRNISRYQLMQLGFFQNDGSLNIYEDAASKKDFIDTAWAQAEPKVQQALELLHGATRNSISNSTWRSSDWWAKIRTSGALNDCFEAFKTISDAKSAVSKGADASFELLVKVNQALRRISTFEPSKVVPQVSSSTVDVSSLPPPTAEQQQHPN